MADQPVGWLATTVTLYDELEEGHSPCIYVHSPSGGQGPDSLPGLADPPRHRQVRRRVADPRQLAVSVQNVASLMHPSVTASSQLSTTARKAVEEMLGDVHVPIGEKDGNLVSSARNCAISNKNVAPLRCAPWM